MLLKQNHLNLNVFNVILRIMNNVIICLLINNVLINRVLILDTYSDTKIQST